jgi:hypothetical protein
MASDPIEWAKTHKGEIEAEFVRIAKWGIEQDLEVEELAAVLVGMSHSLINLRHNLQFYVDNPEGIVDSGFYPV